MNRDSAKVVERASKPTRYGLLPQHTSTHERLQFSEFLFFVAYGSFLVQKLISMSFFAAYFGDWFQTAVNILVVACIALAELVISRFDRKTVALVVICALLVVCALATDYKTFVLFAVLIYGSRKVDFKRIAIFSIVIIVVCTVATIIASLLGIIQDYIWVDSKNERVRHGFGFLYCTYISHLFLNVVMLYAYVKKSLNSLEYIAIVAIDAAIYVTTSSRTSFILVIVFLAAFAFWESNLKGKKQNRGLLRLMAQFSFVVFAAVSLVLVLCYDPGVEWMQSLNKALSGRLVYSNASLNNYGITPFGTDVRFAQNGLAPDGSLLVSTGIFDRNVIDNSYVQILVQRGWIVFVIAAILYLRVGEIAIANNDSLLCIILLIIYMHSLIDPQLLDLHYNTFMFLFAASLPVARSAPSAYTLISSWG